MLAQQIKAAPIFHVHFSPPSTLLSCVLRQSCTIVYQGSSCDCPSFELLSQMASHCPLLTISPDPGRWLTMWWLLTSLFCAASFYSYSPPHTGLLLVCPQSACKSTSRWKNILNSEEVKLLCSGGKGDLITRITWGILTHPFRQCAITCCGLSFVFNLTILMTTTLSVWAIVTIQAF